MASQALRAHMAGTLACCGWATFRGPVKWLLLRGGEVLWLTPAQLLLHSGSRRGGLWKLSLPQSYTTLSLIFPDFILMILSRNSIPQLRLQTLLQDLSKTGQGNLGAWSMGLVQAPQADSDWRGVLDPGKIASVGM